MATSVAVGLASLQRKLTAPVGLVTLSPRSAGLPFVKLSNIILGGHEIGPARPLRTAQELCRESGLFGETLLKRVAPSLRAWQGNIRRGTSVHCGHAIERVAKAVRSRQARRPLRIVATLRRDLRSFAARHRLDRVVVVNVA